MPLVSEYRPSVRTNLTAFDGIGMKPTDLKLVDIRTDGGTQIRDGYNEDVVEAYREAKSLPPIEVVFDGTHRWLIDGFHRLEAKRQSGATTIKALVRQGSLADAQWASYAANREHDDVGLRRTNSDKARAIEAALRHPASKSLSNVQIGKHVGVSEITVRRHRAAIFDNVEDAPKAGEKAISNNVRDAQPEGDDETTPAKPAVRSVTRNGSTYRMNTAAIGARSAAAEPPLENERTVETPPVPSPQPSPGVPEEGAESAGDFEGDAIEPTEPDPQPAAPPALATQEKDQTGYPLPDIQAIKDAFAGQQLIDNVMNAMTRVTVVVKELFLNPAVAYRIHPQRRTIDNHLDQARYLVRENQPWAVCRECKGTKVVGKGNCAGCHGLGWLSKEAFKRFEDVQKIRKGEK